MNVIHFNFLYILTGDRITWFKTQDIQGYVDDTESCPCHHESVCVHVHVRPAQFVWPQTNPHPTHLMETMKLFAKFCFPCTVTSFCTSPSVVTRGKVAVVVSIENAGPTSQTGANLNCHQRCMRTSYFPHQCYLIL